MKRILVLASILLIALVTWGLYKSQALLEDTSRTRVSVSAASLDLNLDVDDTSSSAMDLGEVKPGDIGVVNVTVNNTGTIPGTLCVERETVPPQFILQPVGTCDVVMEPGSSTHFELDWSLPISAHDTEIDGTNFEFVINVFFENGFKVTRKLILTGSIGDPVDTPTATPTSTPTYTMTNTVIVPYPLATDTVAPPAIDTVTNTPTPTCTATDIPTLAPSETPVPTQTPTLVPSETPLPPTEVPTDLPTETPLPTEPVP